MTLHTGPGPYTWADVVTAWATFVDCLHEVGGGRVPWERWDLPDWWLSAAVRGTNAAGQIVRLHHVGVTFEAGAIRAARTRQDAEALPGELLYLREGVHVLECPVALRDILDPVAAAAERRPVTRLFLSIPPL